MLIYIEKIKKGGNNKNKGKRIILKKRIRKTCFAVLKV